MNEFDNMQRDLLELKTQMNPKREAFRVVFFYVIISVLWVLMSDLLLSVLFNDDVGLITKIQTVKGWLYVFVTSLFFYVVILKRLNLFSVATTEVINNYEELSSANEELIALEEELSQRYEELDRNHRALAISEQRYQLIVDGSNDGIWDWDLTTNDFFYSLKLKEFYGYNSEDYENSYNGWVSILHPDDRSKVLNIHDEFFKSTQTIYENKYRIVTKSGETRWIHSRGKVMRDFNGKAIRMAGSHTDITDQVELEENLFYIAYNDRLTSLPNWRKFENKLKKIINNNLTTSSKIAVLYLDVSNFKTVNDTLGHKTGNLFIQNTANILKELADDNLFCARLHGETFALIVSNAKDNEEIESITNKIINRLREPWVYEGHNFYRTINVGIAVYPENALDAATLQRNADTVLNYLKANNKNGIMFYTKEMSEMTINHMNMLNDLHEALLNEDFQLYYQPQICLKSSTIIGVEALIRWFNNKTGFVSPADFIPIAEKTGYIMDIDKWVIEKACKDKAVWNETGYSDIKMSINVSSYTLVNPSFPSLVEETLKKYGLDSSEIEIEITETALISDMEAALKSITYLRELGISIALDDFGTGFSSLTHLKDLPITVLKIDKQFLDKIGKEDDSDMIVSSVIKLSHNLNLKVIAEGVETEQQLEFLSSANCDVGQGYYFSKPISTDQLNSLFLIKGA